MVTQGAIEAGLRALGLNRSSAVVVHSSLRSLGVVEGGALAACRALVSVCGSVMVPAGSWDLTGVPAPPGLARPSNACHTAADWEEFDEALARAVPYSVDLPIDRELGRIPETMRRSFPHARGRHPLGSYLAVGARAEELAGAQGLDRYLGPLETLAAMGGYVLLLGVDHSSNTAIHVAEQRLGRSRFFRYAKLAAGVWMELPNIPGQGHRFDEIEPILRTATREVRIGACRARCVPIDAVIATAERLIRADPGALLCGDLECRCGAAREQRLERLRSERVERRGA